MQYTTNYSLKKPQYADEADIEVINDNTDDVDTLIHQNRTMIAPAFDNTKAYVTGDPVEYLGALYVFIADKAAGAWDASKVEPTTAAEMGGGGTSALADLDDVEITSPTQGQALVYDDTDDIWKNATLPEPVDVEANPSASSTATLSKLKVGSTVYGVSGLPSTSSASNGDVLTLGSGKTPTWAAPAVGGDGVTIDTSTVITSGNIAEYGALNYTATQDCFVAFLVNPKSGYTTYIKINNVTIKSFYGNFGNSDGLPYEDCIFLKTGQTLYVNNNANYQGSYHVYGVQEINSAVVAQLNAMKTGFDGVTYSSPVQMVQSCDEKLQSEIYGKNFSYLDMNRYIAKRGVSSPTITSISHNSVSIQSSTAFQSVVYKFSVVRNKTYNVIVHVSDQTGSAFLDVTNENQMTQITTKNVESESDAMMSFDSGNNDYVCVRLGNGTGTSTSITFSNLCIYIVGNPSVDSTMLKSGYAADAKKTSDMTTIKMDGETSYTGWINYYNGTLSYWSNQGYRYSDFIPIYPDSKIVYNNLLWFIDPRYNIAIAYIAIFDSSKNLLVAYTNYNGQTSLTSGHTSGIIDDLPSGAAYFRYSVQESDTSSVYKLDTLKSIVVNSVNTDTEDAVHLYAYDSKINIIGDSISQGVGVENTYDDSYAGILRKMFMIENDTKMNYGFEPFPSLGELTTITDTMVTKVSSANFTRKWNGTDCYGSDEWSSSTVGATIVFKVNHDFKYMKVSYKEGVTGSFVVKAGSATIATITSTSGTVSAAMSSAIDISSYSVDQEYTIEVASGSVTVSGVELGDDVSYPVFNNYGRAGIPIETVTGDLLSAEIDCDLLIYALGTNGTVTQDKINALYSAMSDIDAKIIILDLCMKSTTTNNTSKSVLLESLALSLGAEYIKMYDLIPKDSNGYTDSTYFITDGLHPSPLGHRCIADAIAKTLKLSVQSKGLAAASFTEW